MTSLYKDNSAQLEGVTTSINNGGTYFFGRLNGDSGTFLDFDHINVLSYSMGHGNDVLNIDGTPLAIAGNGLTVDGGGGADTLNANLSASSNAFTLTDSSLTASNFSATNFETYSLTLGSGADVLTLTHATNDYFSLGNGNDTVTITNAQGYTQVDGGGDVDKLTINNSGQATGVTSTLNNGGAYFFGSLYNVTSRTDFDHIEQVVYKMGTGNDVLNLDGAPISGSSQTTVSVNAGGGSDSLNANLSTVTSAITVTDSAVTTTHVNLSNFETYNLTLGSGNDTVTLVNTAVPYINLAAGDDSLSLTNALTYAQVEMGNGTDTLTVDNSAQSAAVTSTLNNGGTYFFGSLYNAASRTDFDHTEKLNYSMGSGADTLNLDATPLISVSTSLSVDAGGGTDILNGGLGSLASNVTVTAASLTAARLSLANFDIYNLTLGSGNDTVTLSGSVAPYLSMGDGSDTVAMTNVTAYQQIDGGAGIDTLSVNNGSQTLGVTSTLNNGGTYFFGSLYNDASRTDFDHAEVVTYVMGAGADTLNLDATPLNTASTSLSVNAGAGTDVLNGGLGALGTDVTVTAAALTTTRLSLTQFDIYNLTLGSGNDSVTLTGANAPYLSMGAGNDSVTMTNVAGYQSIDGGGGSDAMAIHNSGLAGNSGVTINNGGSYFFGNVFNETSRTDFDKVENVTIDLGTGDNTVNIDGTPLNAAGTSLNIDGGDGSDTLNLGGLVGATIQFVSGGLIVNGTSHFSHFETINVAYGAGNTLIYGAGNDTVTGTDNADILDGGAGNDRMGGAGGNDTIRGGTGNDWINGNAGLDRMSGGAGDDTYYVDDAGDKVFEFTTAGVDDGGHDLVIASISYSLGAFVEDLTVTGVNNGTGNALANAITGDGNLNVLRGMAGNDVLDEGNGGNDKLYGGAGDDTYVLHAKARVYEDTVAGVDDGGIDTVVSAGSYTLGAFVENLTLTASAVSAIGNGLGNVLRGNAVSNKLDGMAGADTLYGGAGNDYYYVDAAGDMVSEQTVVGVDDGGVDRVTATVDFTLGAFIENLVLGGAGSISGTGNGLANTITGNAGNNRLSGLAGNDTLGGGAGADDFVFAHFGSANGNDHLKDFVSGVDHLVFTAADYGWSAGHVLTGAELSLTGVAVGTGKQFVYDPGTHQLYWDSNGSNAGGVVALAAFDNGAAPATGDFLFG